MATKKSIDYQKLNQELEQLLEAMQSGQLDIDQAIQTYKRGQEIIAELHTYLTKAENKVIKLKKNISD
jgi:exodeoxyribonuclease VII small subunit